MFTWHDPDDDVIYQMNYVVTQSDDEGPEYVEWRVNPQQAGSLKEASKYDKSQDGWHRLPPWAMPPQEALDYWHGAVDHRQGVIVAMKKNDRNALCLDYAGLYFADLTLFTNVSDPDGDEVSPGMTVEVGLEATRPLDDPEKAREWLLK